MSANLDLKACFGFLTEPFTKDIAPCHLFRSEQITALFGRLKQLLNRRGIGLLTGEIGAGKSTAIRAFTEELEKNHYDIAYISDPTIGIRGILNATAIQLNLEAGYFKWQLLERLKEAIEKNFYDFKKTTLLLVDEAQLMNPNNLEDLRLFTNFKIDSQVPLTLILLGQPHLKKLIYLKSLEALNQRITMRFHLTGLAQHEVKPYITHQLKIAGRTDALFTDDVITEIFQHARGIPRLINNLCYDCLMEIYQQEKNLVDMPTLEKILLAYESP